MRDPRIWQTIERLQRDTEFALVGYGLLALPEQIIEMTFLTSLNVPYNRLRFLPDDFGNLEKLELLSLHTNQLHWLPDSLCNLSNLRHLDLAENQLLELPDCIGCLGKLRLLKLNNNLLETLPASISECKALKYIRLDNNPRLTALPPGLRLYSLDVRGCKNLHSLPDDLIVENHLDIRDSGIVER